VAKFSRKAQCEPWTGQDAPGRLRAKAGAREGGSTCLAAFRGPVWGGGGGTGTGTELPPERWPDGPWGEPGHEKHAIGRKERKRQAAAWRVGGTRLEAEM